jgi:hypothetical protein
MIRLLLVCLAVAALASPAYAQLGTSRNPPPQHLFNFNGSDSQRGSTSMAERRRQLALSRHPVRHRVSRTQQ